MLSVNSVSTNKVYSSYNDTTTKTKEKEESKVTKEPKDEDSYVKSENKNTGIYTKNKMSESERSELVKQLKADMDARKEQLVNIVNQSLFGQTNAFGKATGDESIWRKLSSGNFTVDPETRAQAQKDIAEDGYWGVKQTSQRLFDFASALAGDDVEKMKEMQAAMEKGFKKATKAWGKELPSICSETMSAANKLFDDYYKSKETA